MTDPAPYLTAAEAVDRDNRLASMASAAIEAEVAAFESIAERYRGVAFTPRTATAVLAGSRPGALVLPDPMVISVESISIDGIVVDDDEPVVWPDGRITRPSGWTGTQIEVTYTHGYQAPPAELLSACTEYVLCVLKAKASGMSRNTLTEAFEGGTTRYSTPDWSAGRPTGWLEVDRLLNSLPDHRTPGIA